MQREQVRLPRLLDGTLVLRNRVAGRNRSSRSRADTVCFRRQDRERRAAEAAPGTVRIQAGRACSARDDREEGLGRARMGSPAAAECRGGAASFRSNQDGDSLGGPRKSHRVSRCIK